MQAEVVISLLPAFCHVTVANACIEVLYIVSKLFLLCCKEQKHIDHDRFLVRTNTLIFMYSALPSSFFLFFSVSLIFFFFS